MKPELLIWGAGGHAKVVADTVRCEARFAVGGFLDDLHPDLIGQPFEGASILGTKEYLLAAREPSPWRVLPGVGSCAARLEFLEFATRHQLLLAAVAHPSAVIAKDVSLGLGTVAAAGAIVNPGSVIGRAVILNTACSVDHECVIEDGAHICPGARLAGNVTIGCGAWIGLGALIREGVRIGAGAVIGAGSLVLDDVPSGVSAFGHPATVRGAAEFRAC